VGGVRRRDGWLVGDSRVDGQAQCAQGAESTAAAAAAA
jgi:hypothetical protein